MADLDKLDLHTLTLLCRIHDEGSLTVAAERSGIAQSTASHTLAKLRRSFGDPLFQRTGRGLLPTHRCARLVARLRPLLDEVQTIAAPDRFRPETARDSFTIAGNFLERAVLLPRLMRRLAGRAPLVSIRFVPALTTSFRMLSEAQCDIALGPFPPAMPRTAKIRSETLGHENYVCFCDPSSRYNGSAAAFSEAPHLDVLYAEGWRPFWKDTAARMDLRYHTRLSLPSYGGVEALLRGSDMILPAPSGLRMYFSDAIAMRPMPFDAGFDIRMMWSPRSDNSAGHAWLRDEILATNPK